MASPVGGDLSGDLISNLADSILVTILSSLRMDEAMRCSILSSRWRHLFPSTLLNFRAFTRSGKNVVEAVTSILAAYQNEPVRSMTTGILCFRPQDEGAVDVWLRDLSNRGIQELSLMYTSFHDTRHMIPESLFACTSLKCLQLINGTLPDTTEAAAASLVRLTKIELNNVKISQNSLNSLLSQCTALEHLTIKSIPRVDSLHVRSRSLKVLYSTGYIKKLFIDDAPNLERVVSTNMDQRKVHIKVSHAPKLEFLGSLGMSDKIDIGDTSFDGRSIHVKTLMPTIKTLAVEMSYAERGYINWFMQLLKLFPHLETLYVKRDNSSAVEPTASDSLWEKRKPAHCMNHHLEKVVFEVFRGHKWEREMARFLHGRSTFLKTMEFHCMDDTRRKHYGRPPSEKWVRKLKADVCLDSQATGDARLQFFKGRLDNHHEHYDDKRYQGLLSHV